MALKGRAWVGVCAVAVAAGLLGIQPAGAQAQVAPTCDASSYSLALQSLTGPPRADLVIRITAKVPDCVLPESLSAQVKLLPFKGAPAKTLAFGDVPAPGGVATVNIGRVPRLRRVQATVSFGAEISLAGQAKTLLKPDLVLTRAYTARSVLLGRPFFVVAIVRERTKDVGLAAIVTVSAGGSALATQNVTVGARRRVVVQVPVSLTELGRIRLTVTVTPSAPVETTLKNNTRAHERRDNRVQAAGVGDARAELRRLRRPVQPPCLRGDLPVRRRHRRQRGRHGTKDARASSRVLPHLLQRDRLQRCRPDAVVHPHRSTRAEHGDGDQHHLAGR